MVVKRLVVVAVRTIQNKESKISIRKAHLRSGRECAFLYIQTNIVFGVFIVGLIRGIYSH